MEGVRVVQMTAGQGGSVAASVLAAWSADVIDASPRAGLGERSGLGGSRRRIFVDVAREEGYTVLLELIGGADVFLTDLDDEVRRAPPHRPPRSAQRQPGVGLRPLPDHSCLLT